MTPTGPHPEVPAAPRRAGAPRSGRGVPGHPEPSNRPARQPGSSRDRYREHINEEELPQDSEVCALVTLEAPAAGDGLD